MTSSQKRKKWTEEEERSLIDKYAEMASDGSLARMRTREKKFRPIAAHVNAGHHAVDPLAYPFLWSWKDASTKVQNMRHQYLLVKQKLISALPSPSDGSHDPSSAIDWADGVSHWPNFLRYKQVFGDAPLPPKPPEPPPPPPPPPSTAVPSFPAAIDDGDLGLGLGFDCCGGEEVDEEGFDYEEVAAAAVETETEPPPPLPPPPLLLMPPARSRKRRRKRPERRRAWAALAAQLARLREREARLEDREEERERERRERERMDEELEEERENEREKARREAEEAARRRREEEREWEERMEERMEERRTEWRKRVEDILSHHRAEMEQIQARILHDQQSIIGQLLGILSQWVACPPVGGLSDGSAGLGSHHQHPHHHQHHQPYHSHLMQGLHHMNGMVPGENRGDGQEDQFIVDG